MAEENPPKDASAPHPADPTDVVGKIDELLHRHRSKSPAGDVIPVLLDPSHAREASTADGIPVLTDVVMGPGQDAKSPPTPSQSRAINSVVIVRRLALALDAEHARLSAEIGGDTNQLGILDRLVAELKHALPAAVRAAILDKSS
ncbi:MAG: hypothetical protein ACJ8G2_11790 [Burkholderiales bacterium]